jgi:hypothetical protein
MDTPNQPLIKQLQQARNTKVITYITGDRKPFITRVADDVIPVLNEHLEKLGHQPRISFYLYTRGGDMIAPIKIIKLLRNHTDELEVIVPYRAHSAGTLIALGADKIVMGKLAELSPVDPSTTHPFNPKHPQTKQPMEISVEDLNSYLLMAQEQAKIPDEKMSEIFKKLSDDVHPLSIGNVYRAFRMARQITKKLLKVHFGDSAAQDKIDKIVKQITRDICIHGYPITRDEGKSLGLNIEPAPQDQDKLMWNLYQAYEQTLELKKPFNPVELLGGREYQEMQYIGAFIESEDLTHKFMFRGKIRRLIKNNQPTIDINIESSVWEK